MKLYTLLASALPFFVEESRQSVNLNEKQTLDLLFLNDLHLNPSYVGKDNSGDDLFEALDKDTKDLVMLLGESLIEKMKGAIASLKAGKTPTESFKDLSQTDIETIYNTLEGNKVKKVLASFCTTFKDLLPNKECRTDLGLYGQDPPASL
jgi:hypothetical protein